MDTVGHYLLTEEEVQLLVDELLGSLGVTVEELKAQAASGKFASDRIRRAWYSLDGLDVL